jgi:hypothetical protein
LWSPNQRKCPQTRAGKWALPTTVDDGKESPATHHRQPAMAKRRQYTQAVRVLLTTTVLTLHSRSIMLHCRPRLRNFPTRPYAALAPGSSLTRTVTTTTTGARSVTAPRAPELGHDCDIPACHERHEPGPMATGYVCSAAAIPLNAPLSNNNT